MNETFANTADLLQQTDPTEPVYCVYEEVYRQFCELYLFPLLLQCYKGLDFQPFLL